ncbi:lysine-specific demethylase [Babesia gibsoni]|uniref:Lysine-specific demethylase n=1 Tax=Babesia gibsoni TaxID=33632 RepID=A0AAD8PF45_BABGI|nr:lysine-specific demethylase [Babesia gibsoni]
MASLTELVSNDGLSSSNASPYTKKVDKRNDKLIYEEDTQQKRRRSTRVKRPPEIFNIVHEKRLDKDIVAAIKRSKLETYQLRLDYASFDEIPTIHATSEEFKDPVHFWNTYAHIGEKYGAVKVVPPKGWESLCPLDTNRMKFKGFSHPTYEWDCEKMKKCDHDLLIELFGNEKPSVEEVEKKYWDIVKAGDRSLVVKYGADLNVYSPEFKEYLVNQSGTKYESDVWNLKNLPKSPGSLLRYTEAVIPGVNTPWLYIGMCLTSFCWHTEDNYFGAINYHHWGDPKIWYIVPPQYAGRIESMLKNYLASESAEFAVYSLRVQIAPDVLISNGIPIYRTVQREGEFIFAWPRAFHSGLNVGYNCNEACNLAPLSWLPMGIKSMDNYKYNRKTCLSIFSLVMIGACNSKDFKADEIISITRFLSLMLSHEYELRKNASYPTVQMYIHLNNGGSLDIGSLVKDTPASGCYYVIQVLCGTPMKDCDLCDTPTFGSCLTCAHCNCTVCISCVSYHPCDCKDRIVLYRFPLQVLSRLISIGKRHYVKQIQKEWTVPSQFELLNQDARSVFNVESVLTTPESNTPTNTSRVKLNSLFLGDQKMGYGWQDLESMSTTAGSNWDDSPRPTITSEEWDPMWFRDLRAASVRIRSRVDTESKAGEESLYGEIRFCYPCSLSSCHLTNSNDNRSLAAVTKFTLRYMLLSLEEEHNESM